jgi:hypothetical protein
VAHGRPPLKVPVRADSTGGKRYGLIMSEDVEGVVTLVTDDDVTKYLVDGSLYKLFSGLRDEVHFYNRSLSQEEILWLAGNRTPVAKPF